MRYVRCTDRSLASTAPVSSHGCTLTLNDTVEHTVSPFSPPSRFPAIYSVAVLVLWMDDNLCLHLPCVMIILSHARI